MDRSGNVTENPMNILEAILSAQNGGATRQLGARFGLDDQQVESAVKALLPALAGGVSRNASTPDGLESLLGALTRGNHQRYVDEAGSLDDESATLDGNGILGHIFGSKEVSRQVATSASAQTGIGADVLKKMLPLVAAMLMGGLGRQASSGGGFGTGGAPAGFDVGGARAPAQGGGLLDMLTPMLDQNRDGSALDDLLGMAARYIGRR